MAQSIYREWFVSFRFPGHEKVKMVDSPMGKIPEGWDVTSILECPDFQLIEENIRPYEGKKVYYATADIEGIQIIGKGIEYSYNEKPSRAQKQPEVNSVWFARMQETYKVIAFTNANKLLCQKCMLSSGFAGFRSFDNLTFAFLFYTINSRNFHQRKDLFCTGATQRSLTNEGLGRIQIILPTRKMVERFSEITQPNLDMILILHRQNSILRQTRDFLLHKLISGELEVSELDIKTEEMGK
jgi:type I restriction enzyme S subunit